jgi:uncharacterized protein YgiM (DUF1202 family)
VNSAETNFIPIIDEQIAAITGATPAVQPPSAYSAEVAVDLLNVRSLPAPSGVVLKQLCRGVEVRVYEDRNGWRRIDPVSSCWVRSHFLQVAAPFKLSAIYCAQVTTDLLNVRSLPSLAGNVTNQLARGTIVYVHEEQDNWSRIDETSSLWVASAYLAPASAATV